jgi:hypothetical protein
MYGGHTSSAKVRTGSVVRKIVVALVLVSCAPERFVDRATLLADPAAKLRPPGVVELGHFGSDRITTFEGPQAAFDGFLFGTQDAEQGVLSYYESELGRSGWQRDRMSAFRATTETVAWGWCKGRMDFRLAVEDQARAFRPEVYRGQTFATVFATDLQSRELPCPTPTPGPPAAS